MNTADVKKSSILWQKSIANVKVDVW